MNLNSTLPSHIHRRTLLHFDLAAIDMLGIELLHIQSSSNSSSLCECVCFVFVFCVLCLCLCFVEGRDGERNHISWELSFFFFENGRFMFLVLDSQDANVV